MNIGGWVIMISSVGTVTMLFSWCIWKVLSDPDKASHVHSTSENDGRFDPHRE